jgi:hypothetical protein
MTAPAGVVVPLLVRPLPVHQLDRELGVSARWTVRNPALELGTKGALQAVMKNDAGAYICSCGELRCRDVEAVQQLQTAPPLPANPCVLGEPDRRVD